MARPLIDSRARDVRRRVEVIQRKLADLRQLGVICAFTYTSVRNSGSFFTLGDQRITDVIECHKDEIVRNLLNPDLAPCGGLAGGEVHLILPLLPAPLEQLSRRALQSLLVGILKDLGIRWSDPRPQWWPLDVPFVPSCSIPDEFSGNWTKMLQRVIKSVYNHFSYDITTYVASIMHDCSTSSVGDSSSPCPSDTPATTPTVCAENKSVADTCALPAYKAQSADQEPRDVGFRGDQTNTSPAPTQMVLTRDRVVGRRGYPMTRSHPPVQYTKFTVVSASSIACPRRRVAKVQLDKVPIGKNRLALQVEPRSAPSLPRQLALAPPLTLATSAPVLTPSTLPPAKSPRCLASVPSLIPMALQQPPLPPPLLPPPPLPSNMAEQSLTPKTLPASTKPLLVKDASRHTGPLFGRLDFKVQPPGGGAGSRPSPAKGVGQRMNKLHFHMMTVVNKAKRSALIRSNKGRELHRVLTATTEVPAARRVSEQPAASPYCNKGGGVAQVSHCSRGANIGSPTERKRDCEGSSDAPSLVAGTVEEEEKEVGSHHVTTVLQSADANSGVPRQLTGMSTGGVGRGGGGVSGTSGHQKVLTFHVYEDPITAFKVKRSRQD